MLEKCTKKHTFFTSEFFNLTDFLESDNNVTTPWIRSHHRASTQLLLNHLTDARTPSHNCYPKVHVPLTRR